MFAFLRNVPLIWLCTLLVVPLTLLAFGSLVLLSALQSRQETLSSLEKNTTVEAEIIAFLVEGPMTRGDDAGTREVVRRIAERYPDVELYLGSFMDSVTYSGRESAVRQPMTAQFSAPEIRQLVQRALSEKVQATELVSSDAGSKFVYVSSVANSESCHHCHGASQPILGALVVAKDVTPTIAQLRADILENTGYATVGMLALIAALLFFLRRMLVTPVVELAQAADNVARGNLDTRFPVPDCLELYRLRDSLSQMVEHLKTELNFSQGILQGMGLPCVIVDAEDRITFINRRALETFGMSGSPKSYKGRPRGEAMFRDPAAVTDTRRVITSGRDIVDEPFSFSSGGRTRHALISASRLFDLQGRLFGAFSLMADVTDAYEQRDVIKAQGERIAKAAEAAQAVAEKLDDAASRLSQSIERSAQGAEAQALRASQTATAMSQMNDAIVDVGKSATEAANASHETRLKAQDGAAVIGKAMDSIRQVKGNSVTLKDGMRTLGDQAQAINQIINVISDIADQTNLLALNAAIEAARAGEAGRGFAVVADEVRKLAEKTMASTVDVTRAIGAIQTSVEASVAQADTTVAAIETADSLSAQSEQALEEIIRMVDHSEGQVNAIASASEEQAATSEQINRSVAEISEIASDTSEAMNDANTAVGDLTRQMHVLSGLVEDMRTA